MWRYWLLEAVKVALSLLVALVLAALLSCAGQHVHGFWSWLSALSARLLDMISGRFGTSSTSGAPAISAVASVVPVTLELAGMGAVIALAVGLPLGLILSASRLLGAAGQILQTVSATPTFVACLVLLWIATNTLHASSGYRDLALSLTVVGMSGAASVQLALRRAAELALERPYRKGLAMMGLSAFEIDMRYVLPEILAGVFAAFGEIAMALLTSTAIVEWVYRRKGAAVLFLSSVRAGDWNVAALVLLSVAAIVIAAAFIGKLAAFIFAPEELDP